jgi:hypothetical protein
LDLRAPFLFGFRARVFLFPMPCFFLAVLLYLLTAAVQFLSSLGSLFLPCSLQNRAFGLVAFEICWFHADFAYWAWNETICGWFSPCFRSREGNDSIRIRCLAYGIK